MLFHSRCLDSSPVYIAVALTCANVELQVLTRNMEDEELTQKLPPETPSGPVMAQADPFKPFCMLPF